MRVAYGIQQAIYATAQPYDVDAGERGEWDTPTRTDVALFAHLPLAALIDGEDVGWSLVAIDLTQAHEAISELLRWRNLCIDGSASQPVTPHQQLAVPSGSPAPEVEQRGGEATHGNAPSPPESLATKAVGAEGQLPPTIASLKAIAAAWPLADQEAFRFLLAQEGVDRTNPEAVRQAMDRYWLRDVHVDPAPRPASTELPAAARPPRTVDEGAELGDGDVAAAGKEYKALDDAARSWVTEAGTFVRLSGSTGRRTVRRFEILAGLCALAKARYDDDSILRAVLAHIFGDEAHQASHAVARLVADLDLDEAKRFAGLCRAVAAADASVAWSFDQRGRCTLSPSVTEMAA